MWIVVYKSAAGWTVQQATVAGVSAERAQAVMRDVRAVYPADDVRMVRVGDRESVRYDRIEERNEDLPEGYW